MDSFFPQCSLEHLEKKLDTNFVQGLTKEKVKQNFLKYGFNKLKENKKENLFKKIINQFNNLFVYILLAICFFTFFLGLIENQKEELFESLLIFSIICINSFLGALFEHHKEKSLFLIKQKTKPCARVLRNSELKFILREQIVIGDIVFLETGDIVPADLRLIETHNLKTNEVILTGEISSVVKDADILQKKFLSHNSPNLVFMDTIIVSGRGRGVVIKIGQETQIGKINNLVITEKKNKTPLEKNIQQLSKFLSLIIFCVIFLNFILNLIKYFFINEVITITIIKKLFLSSIVLAVAIIPESLLAIITIILAIGVKKVIKKKAIVKNLKTLETLGAVNIICTDKTGTLTQNKMIIQKLYLNYTLIDINNDLKLDSDISQIINYGILCNDNYSSINNIKYYEKENLLFDPIDQSFIDLGNLWKLEINKIQAENKKIKEFPFDNNYKFMATIHKINDQKNLIIIKGAYETILNLSYYIKYKKRFILKNKNNLKKIEKSLNSMSSEGYKVLGIAYSYIKNNDFNLNNSNIEKILSQTKNQIIFLGGVGIKDSVRSEILPTIKELKKAFITPIMITGDSLQTAIKIASDLKIFQYPKDLAITGEILDKLEEDKFLSQLHLIKVYARVNPEHKLKIIKAWQKKEKIVAMIGDGVNDAPSIQKADIGIAMGKTGTDITKNTSDIILIEDNFETIKNAIKEGRNIFDNIKKSIIFLLSCNVGEIIVILLNTCLGIFFFNKDFVILNTLQILWINLVTDSLVAISLGVELPEENLMNKPPRSIKNSLLNKKMIYKILLEGFMIGFFSFIAAFIGYKYNKNNNQSAQTIAFMVLSLSQLVHVFNLRSFNKSIFSLKINFYLIISFIISVFLQIIIFVIPFFRQRFYLSNFLSYIDIMIIIIFSIMPLIIIEIMKKIINIFDKNKKY
ncbi:MAG: cation-transporting P-type ATPase [Candidatus Phytoplasma stylosanthis]|uniref:cation-translocating P-type ATPase n=1 Tax=Candidatus Phytoplasma stylosanthis TaxID=2798314 RepID=UPI00293A3772|nr:cation-transporting P-type ATPase [Candidatus Phytoplasma stylosanthis]MDV3167893.1 cation-transporting P-type ATPase [Candidatus Phytoplasma stylosanthis]MDV3170728.1 cation-transporting P-type ATPase [Candidatus Phytoplasma stylosanthis]MDV3173985.1 cation-transporting P-type ATPase [Candidatus Phytoplasma stylosanthis]MDV3202603.1 cation-transporting P-type ATPase [Candidatus Phytoplasma stylosanthis]